MNSPDPLPSEAPIKYPDNVEISDAFNSIRARLTCPMCHAQNFSLEGLPEKHPALMWRAGVDSVDLSAMAVSSLLGLKCGRCGYLALFDIHVMRKFIDDSK